MVTKRDLVKLLKQQGFYKTDFGKGSHEVWEHEDGRLVTVPLPKQKDYKPGILTSILKSVGLK